MSGITKLLAMIEKHGYAKTADLLDYTYAYVHMVANGTIEAGDPFWRRVRDFRESPPPKTVTIRYSEDEEPMRQRHLALTMDERKKGLDLIWERSK